MTSTPYIARINWRSFSGWLKNWRRCRGLGMRAAAREAGVPFGTYRQAEKGRAVNRDAYRALCAWLSVEPELFLRGRAGIMITGAAI